MHRWIDIAEIPFVCGQLAVGMQIIAAHHEIELLFAELLIHQAQRQNMECKIPGRIPGIFPLVRHRNDVRVVHVMPMLVTRGAADPAERIRTAFAQPLVHVVIIKLLGPQHACQRLPHQVSGVGIQ